MDVVRWSRIRRELRWRHACGVASDDAGLCGVRAPSRSIPFWCFRGQDRDRGFSLAFPAVSAAGMTR